MYLSYPDILLQISCWVLRYPNLKIVYKRVGSQLYICGNDGYAETGETLETFKVSIVYSF